MITRTLLFDLDGTLTDPRPGIVGSLRFALEQLGMLPPSDDVLATYIGPPLRGTFSTLLDTSESERIEEAVRLYRQRFGDIGLFENDLYDGVPAMLADVCNASSAAYIATSKPEIYADRILKHFGLDHHFAGVYGAELDGRFDDKAELLAHLLESEGIVPEVAVMIGDRGIDIAAAKANGIRGIGVLWGYGSAQELCDADVLCNAPGELMACLARI